MNVARPLIVDSFAGGGGASTGIEMALGRSPDIAINHSADALAMHAVNHPDTLHLDSNIWDVSPREVTGGRPVGLFWASPDCKHFSKAKGGKPMDRNIRDLAWVVVRWAEEAKPDVIILENVEEFVTWGPLGNDGRPIVELRGHTFEDWTRRLKRAGYKVQWRELRACDYGAPTIRKRFFMIARRDGKPIVWPARTHGDPKRHEDAKLIRAGRLKPWRTAAEIIDWSLPCPSIFDTADEIMAKHGVRAIRPLADATMRRIARGVVRYVLEAQKPFVVPVAHSGDARVNSVDEPVRTQTGHSRSDHAVVVPAFVGCGGRAGQSAPRGGGEPTGTMTAKPDGCVVASVLVETAHGEVSPGGVKRWGKGVKPTDEPMGVGTISGNHAVAAIHMSRFTQNGIGHGADEPVDTVMAGAPKFGVVAATMVQTGYGEREGQMPRALDVERPLGTQVAGAAKHAVVAAFMAQHTAGSHPGRPARGMDEPVSTLSATGAQQSVIAAHLQNMRGSDRRDASADAPVPTLSAQGTHAALIAPFLQTYYGTGDGQAADGPLRTDTTKDRFGLVTVDIEGATYAIADIGMRMLTPRERFRAQGFPESYVIDRRLDGTSITATVQGSCCGNSVCPPMAEALVRANCADLAEFREAAE